jgi:hypothetical protein
MIVRPGASLSPSHHVGEGRDPHGGIAQPESDRVFVMNAHALYTDSRPTTRPDAARLRTRTPSLARALGQ